MNSARMAPQLAPNHGDPPASRTNPTSATTAPAELLDLVRGIVLAPGFVQPRVPEEAMERLRLSRKVDLKAEEALALLERDTMLSVQVVKAAQVVCEAWGLGPEIVGAVRAHHSVTAGKTNAQVPRLAAVVAMADDLARRLDAGAGESRASESVAAIRLIGLSEEAARRIEVDAEAATAGLG